MFEFFLEFLDDLKHIKHEYKTRTINYEDSQKIAINIHAKILIYDNAQHIKSNKILFT